MNNALQTCHSLHQTWAATLLESEQEIDQLLSLLEELPDGRYRSLHMRTTDYAQTLSQLKDRIHHLQLDVVCHGTYCSSASGSTPGCPDTHFVAPSTSNSLITAISVEYGLIKDRCQAFLGELMGLNLI